MRVFLNKRDGFLYRIYADAMPQAAGGWVADPCFPNQGQRIDRVNPCDFTPILSSPAFSPGAG